MTRTDLIEWIKRQLGYPTRNVELTEDQLNDAVTFALQEVQPWYSMTEYVTFDLNNGSAVDLSEFQIYNILDIIKIPKNAVSSGNSYEDPFSYPYGYGGIAAGGYGIMGTQTYISRLTNSDIHHVISAYAKQYNELFYARLAQLIVQRTAGTILPTENYEFDPNTNILYIATGYPPSTLLTLEYVPKLLDVDKVRDDRYLRCTQDLALGQAMITLSRVVGKYDVSNAPAAVRYDLYHSDGQDLIGRARDELKRISRTTYITD